MTIDNFNKQYEPWPPNYEYVYLVQVNAMPAYDTEGTANWCRRVSGQLQCRPKGQDTLTCYLFNNPVDQDDTKRCDHDNKYFHEMELFTESRFEIKFNAEGVTYLNVSREIARNEFNVINEVMRQFDFVFEILTYLNLKTFTIMEDSQRGNFEYNVNITHNPLESDDEEDLFAFAPSINARPQQIQGKLHIIRKVKRNRIYSPNLFVDHMSIQAQRPSSDLYDLSVQLLSDNLNISI